MIFGRHMNRYYLRFAPLFLLGVIVLLVEDYMMLLIPEYYQMLVNGLSYGFVDVDGVRQAFDMAFLIDRICLPLALVIIGTLIGRFLWRPLFISPAILLEKDLRNRMFDRCRHLSCQFYGTNKVGNLMSLFTNDLDTVQECFGWGILMFVDASVIGSMSIIKMWNMDKFLTCLSMIPMGLLLASALLVGREMTKRWDSRQAAFSKLSDFSQESFSGIAVIKAFVKEAGELMAFKKLNVENEKANMDHTKISVLMRVLVTFFVESVIGIILGYGGYLIYKGSFNAGQLVEFIGYFNSVIFPVMAVSELIDMSSRGKASMDRIGQLLDAEADVVDRENVKPMENIRGDITFKNLTFRYPGGEYDVLKDISFTINAGESVGIVGKTGTGKTTLVDLLLRTYNVPDGTVFVDGQDVNSVKIADRKDDVADAAVLADVDGNIREFPQGYETILGERGVTVSGGQKQRISIARALLRDAPILILDDSVSAVDTKTEKTILENLRRVRNNKTTILIAHRISTVESMDKLLFLDDGKLIAVGSHAQLLETCPAYQKMVQLQQLEEEGGNANG